MSEDRDRSLLDKEEQLEEYGKLLHETKKKKLPEMSADKKKLVERIVNLRIVKEDYSLSRRERINAENESFECYEQLLSLNGGDADLTARMLGSYRPFRIEPDAEP